MAMANAMRRRSFIRAPGIVGAVCYGTGPSSGSPDAPYGLVLFIRKKLQRRASRFGGVRRLSGDPKKNRDPQVPMGFITGKSRSGVEDAQRERLADRLRT